MIETHQDQTEPMDGPDAPAADETELLLTFLRNRDAACPACGYNLRNLTRPLCPECREGYQKPRIGPFVATIAPSIFSGICGMIMLLPLMLVPSSRPPPIGAYLLDLFGLSSGLFGVCVFVFRHRFLRQSHTAQMVWAAVTWTIHVLAFFVLLIGTMI
jgi:hypothetical protein